MLDQMQQVSSAKVRYKLEHDFEKDALEKSLFFVAGICKCRVPAKWEKPLANENDFTT